MFKALALSSLAAHAMAAPVSDAPPVWTLTDITYASQVIYSTPAHLAVHYGSISFNLTNSDAPYTTHCTGTASRDPGFFYGDQVFLCDAPTGPGTDPRDKTTFVFSQPNGFIGVNATWICGGYGPLKSGTGSGLVDLDCKTTEYKNANWTTPGDIYSSTTVNCQPGRLTITPKLISE